MFLKKRLSCYEVTMAMLTDSALAGHSAHHMQSKRLVTTGPRSTIFMTGKFTIGISKVLFITNDMK